MSIASAAQCPDLEPRRVSIPDKLRSTKRFFNAVLTTHSFLYGEFVSVRWPQLRRAFGLHVALSVKPQTAANNALQQSLRTLDSEPPPTVLTSGLTFSLRQSTIKPSRKTVL